MREDVNIIAVSIKVIINLIKSTTLAACFTYNCTTCSKNVSPPTNVGNAIKVPRTNTATNFDKIGVLHAHLSREGFHQAD